MIKPMKGKHNEQEKFRYNAYVITALGDSDFPKMIQNSEIHFQSAL